MKSKSVEIVAPLKMNMPQEYEIFILKMHIPFLAHDPVIRKKELSTTPYTCPYVVQGSAIWVDSIRGNMILFHPLNPQPGFGDRMIWIPIQHYADLLVPTGDSVNHPDRWMRYGKPMAWLISRYMSRKQRLSRWLASFFR